MKDELPTSVAPATVNVEAEVELRRLTTGELRDLLAHGPSAALVPVGSVEPHGPHLPLGTDTTLGEESARRAAIVLRAHGIGAVVAPAVAYGVTEFARGFVGAVGVAPSVLTAMLSSIGAALLREGFTHVCFVSNHLEPDHDAAVRAALVDLPQGAASVASPLTRRWGRTLSDEYKSGACHAGEYETSLAMAAGERVRDVAWSLPALETSLSDGIRAGQRTFLEMGLGEAYTGAPARATRDEGERLYEKLVTMIVTEVEERLRG